MEVKFDMDIRDPIIRTSTTNTPSATYPTRHAFDGDFDGDGEGPLNKALQRSVMTRSVADLKLFDDSKQQSDKGRSLDF